MNSSNYEITVNIRPQRGELHPSQFHPNGREAISILLDNGKDAHKFLSGWEKERFLWMV